MTHYRWPRWLRRKRKPAFEPIIRPFAEPMPLGDEVIRHLYAAFGSMPPGDRRDSRWVMNLEWLNEVRKATDAIAGPSAWAFRPPPSMLSGDVFLLGLPIEVRGDGGVPHLEQR